MKLSKYVRINRERLAKVVRALCPNNPHYDDEELGLWVMNDPGLYFEAKRAGVEECQEA